MDKKTIWKEKKLQTSVQEGELLLWLKTLRLGQYEIAYSGLPPAKRHFVIRCRIWPDHLASKRQKHLLQLQRRYV